MAACSMKSLANMQWRKPAAAALDSPGHGQLLLAAEQRNLAHLHQVDSHRIVDPIVLAGVFRWAFVLIGRELSPASSS